MFVGIGFVTLPMAVMVYTKVNSRRGLLEREMVDKGVKYTPEDIRELGDRAPNFRYTL